MWQLVVESAPVVIALIALFVSLYSVYLTRESFISAHRPYVWAASYSVPDPQNQSLDPIPSRIAFRVQNAPAQIRKLTITIGLDEVEEPLFKYEDTDLVRFPGERSEWSFSIGQETYSEIMNRPDHEKRSLLRTIEIKYAWLDGRKVYLYDLTQSFDSIDDQWKNEREEAS